MSSCEAVVAQLCLLYYSLALIHRYLFQLRTLSMWPDASHIGQLLVSLLWKEAAQCIFLIIWEGFEEELKLMLPLRGFDSLDGCCSILR